MSKLGNIPAPYKLPSTREAVPSSSFEDEFFSTIEKFFKGRSFRRVYFLAGVGSVALVAWYLYRRSGSIPQPPPLPQIQQAIVEPAQHDHLVEAPPLEEKVVINCCPRGYFTPSIATAPMHLETFLRVATIPYEVNFCNEPSNSEIPFMSLGSQIGNDFRESVRILAEKFDTELDRDVPASRKTASHLIDVLLENQFSWGILIWRWIFDEGKSLGKIQPLNSLGSEVANDVAQQVREATRYHPIGRLNRDEFVQTIFEGIKDISAALGKHKFFLGEKPGSVDCHAFAILSIMMWNMPGSPFETQLRKYSNLVQFVKRMKELYWPDWNQLIYKPEEYEQLNTRDRSYSASVSRHPSEEKIRKRKTSKSREGHNLSRGEHVQKVVETLEKGDANIQEDVCSEKEQSPPATPQSIPEPLQHAPEAPVQNLEGETITVIVNKKDNIQKESSEENSTSAEPSSGEAPVNVTPPGILKAVPVSVGKQRSGLVNTSGGNTNLPVQEKEIIQASEPTLTSPKEPSQHGSSQQGQTQAVSQPIVVQQPLPTPQPNKQDSVFHVHRPSVKFADTTSVESTLEENNANSVPSNKEENPSPPKTTLAAVAQPPLNPQSQIPIRKVYIETVPKMTAVAQASSGLPYKSAEEDRTQQANNNPINNRLANPPQQQPISQVYTVQHQFNNPQIQQRLQQNVDQEILRNYLERRDAQLQGPQSRQNNMQMQHGGRYINGYPQVYPQQPYARPPQQTYNGVSYQHPTNQMQQVPYVSGNQAPVGMSAPGMNQYNPIQVQQMQKTADYYSDFYPPTGMLPSSYIPQDQMSPAMLNRWF